VSSYSPPPERLITVVAAILESYTCFLERGKGSGGKKIDKEHKRDSF
jgi:hypothetical protein